MKDKNNKLENLKKSTSGEVSDEQLMAFVDGELKDLDAKKLIERLPDLKERTAPFVWTRRLLKSLKIGILDEPTPESMIDMVREGIAAQEQGRSLIRDLEIMAAVDGEVGFGRKEVYFSERQDEIVKNFSWTNAQLNRMRTGVLQEAVPENIARLVEEGLKEKETQTVELLTLKMQKFVTGFFNQVASWWSRPLPAYSLVGVAATGILAISLYLTVSPQAPLIQRFGEPPSALFEVRPLNSGLTASVSSELYEELGIQTLMSDVMPAVRLPHGPYEMFYENGRLSERGNYINGEPVGLYETFYPNGQLFLRGNYINGKRDGLWEWFHEDGNLTKTETYRNGELVE